MTARPLKRRSSPSSPGARRRKSSRISPGGSRKTSGKVRKERMTRPLLGPAEHDGILLEPLRVS